MCTDSQFQRWALIRDQFVRFGRLASPLEYSICSQPITGLTTGPRVIVLCKTPQASKHKTRIPQGIRALGCSHYLHQLLHQPVPCFLLLSLICVLDSIFASVLASLRAAELPSTVLCEPAPLPADVSLPAAWLHLRLSPPKIAKVNPWRKKLYVQAHCGFSDVSLPVNSLRVATWACSKSATPQCRPPDSHPPPSCCSPSNRCFHPQQSVSKQHCVN